MKIDRQKVYEKYEGHCAYCGREIKFKEMQVDHIIPKCQLIYGANRLLHIEGVKNKLEKMKEMIESPSNLMPSCRMCNHYKRSQSLEEFRVTIKTLHKRLEKIYIVRVAMNYGIFEVNYWNGLFFFERLEYIKQRLEKLNALKEGK